MKRTFEGCNGLDLIGRAIRAILEKIAADRRHDLFMWLTNRRRPVVAALAMAACLWATGSESQGYHMYRITFDESGGGDGAISPDGKAFVVSSRRTGDFELWLYQIETAKWTRLTNSPGDDFEAQWSPDGTRLVFTSTRSGNKNIWLLDLADGGEKRLTFGSDDEEYPCWSPDGSLVAYTGGPWHHRDFFTVKAAGGPPTKITRRSGSYGACSFFRDGKKLVYHAYDSGSGHISTLDILTGEETTVTAEAAWDYKATVSPDSRWIAFSRAAETMASLCPSGIWLMRSDLSRGGPLTNTLGADRWPTWDRDGEKLFFHRIVDEGRSVNILDRKTGRNRTVVDASERPGAASFSPDTKQIVYSAVNQGRYVIRLRNLANNEATTLDTGKRNTLYPRWSPDGKKIAYVSDEEGRWNVYTCRLDGTERTNWTASLRDAHGMDGPVDWSPDSSQLVFHADTKPYEADIYVVDLHTSVIKNLTSDAWFDEAPSWTPDGKGVIFMSTRGGNWTWGFYRLDVGSGQIEAIVAPDSVEKNFPRIAKDGSVIYSIYDSKGVEFLAESHQLQDARRIPNSESRARWPSYSPSGDFILYTTVQHQTEYWVADNMRAPDSPLNHNIWSELDTPKQVQFSEVTGLKHAAQEQRNPVHFIRRCVSAPGWRDSESAAVPAKTADVGANN